MTFQRLTAARRFLAIVCNTEFNKQDLVFQPQKARLAILFSLLEMGPRNRD